MPGTLKCSSELIVLVWVHNGLFSISLVYGIQVNSRISQQQQVVARRMAKGKERQWLRHQSIGELDDTKIIDGLTGEKAIYKRRGELEPE
eukprot:g38584.t1